jgi:hypothetical protein
MSATYAKIQTKGVSNPPPIYSSAYSDEHTAIIMKSTKTSSYLNEDEKERVYNTSSEEHIGKKRMEQ